MDKKSRTTIILNDELIEKVKTALTALCEIDEIVGGEDTDIEHCIDILQDRLHG